MAGTIVPLLSRGMKPTVGRVATRLNLGLQGCVSLLTGLANMTSISAPSRVEPE